MSAGLPYRAPDRRRLRVGQWLGVTIGVLLVLAVGGIALALAADARLTDRRETVVDRVVPAQLSAQQLANALVNQDTGVRGFLLSGEQRFLEPYREGRRAEIRARRRLGDPGAPYAREALVVRRSAAAWRQAFVLPVLRADGRPTEVQIAVGKERFDEVRRTLARLTGELAAQRREARDELLDTARVLRGTLIGVGVLIVIGLLGAGLLLRRIVTAPLARLGRQARQVSGGDFHVVLETQAGAREIAEMAEDVEAMRRRILSELESVEVERARVEEQAADLARSNAELEQFAYVASHDLQEPLRKVASFCQALQRRYEGQLDERADQYIEFAVDGAKRMQILVNDLLAFSRVGRSGAAHEPVDTSVLVEDAQRALADAIEAAGATIVAGELPQVRGEHALLSSVFQNLIANAVKFHASEPPRVELSARREDGDWHFECADNGIGIDADYAERIFVIFQRLHARDAYPGTGIGLAMCRKIVEHHGGRMWLVTDDEPGARIAFTLPVDPSEEEHP